MRFRRKVYNYVGLFLFKKFVHGFSVADVYFDKTEIWIFHDGRERRKVARISELVQTNNSVVRMSFEHIEHEIRADEACAACYKNIHHNFSYKVNGGFVRKFLARTKSRLNFRLHFSIFYFSFRHGLEVRSVWRLAIIFGGF